MKKPECRAEVHIKLYENSVDVVYDSESNHAALTALTMALATVSSDDRKDDITNAQLAEFLKSQLEIAFEMIDPGK